MVLEGKGFFTWKIPACERGDINAIISIALASKLTHVLIKIADGTVAYNTPAYRQAGSNNGNEPSS